MAINPNDSRHIKRLRDAMEHSKQRMKHWKDAYLAHLKAVAGSRFGDVENKQEPLNFLKLAMRTYRRSLITKAPKALVSSNTDANHVAAYEFELALNTAIREAKIEIALKRAAMSALLGVGVVKVGISSSGMVPGTESFLHDPGHPYVDHVLFDDWLHDIRSAEKEQWDWCGNRYRLPLAYVLENPMFSPAGRDRLNTSNKTKSVNEDSDSSNMIDGDSLRPDEDYIDYVDLWDLWLPRENLVITLADDDGSDEPLRIVEWDGPECGPYHILGFDELPGNTIPSSPAADMYDLHNAVNRVLSKLMRQADRQKTIGLASGVNIQSGGAANIQNAADGELIQCDDPSTARELPLGGVNQGNMAFLLALRELVSYAGGNIEVMAGLAQNAQTLGQERILAESSNTTLAEMQSTFKDFTSAVVRDFAWYVYHDPFMEISIAKEIPDTPVRIEKRWTAERRQVDWQNFDVDIEPFSMKDRGPGERLQTITHTLQILSGFGPMMQQQGLQIDIPNVLRVIARYTDIDEISQFVTAGGMPLTRAPQPIGDYAAPPPSGLKIPGNKEYIHRSVGSGQNAGNALMQQMAAMMGNTGSPA